MISVSVVLSKTPPNATRPLRRVPVYVLAFILLGIRDIWVSTRSFTGKLNND